MEQEEKKNYTTIADLENLAKEKYIELLKQGKLTDILDTMAKFPNFFHINFCSFWHLCHN